MGIYIKGMKMPKDDEVIRFIKLLNGKIVAAKQPTKQIGDICEVIEVTEPHGPLIDVTKIPYLECADPEVGELVGEAPTVIEAEG